MRVLFLLPHYYPDKGPSAELFKLLCEELVKKECGVNVLCGVPHYPTGRVPKHYKGLYIRKEVINGVRIIRLPLPSINRNILWKRLIQSIIFQIEALICGLFIKYDIIISVTAAIQVFIPYLILGPVRKKKCVYSVHDLYPDILIKLGIIKNRFIINLISSLERICLKNSTKIRILSYSFLRWVEKYGIKKNQIRLIYDWVDINFIHPLPRENPFSIEYGLLNKFCVIYSGNIGYSQGLDVVLEAADRLKRMKDIMFIIIGDGVSKKMLEEIARQKKLENVLFLPFQQKHRYPEVLSSADILLVTLKKGLSRDSLPSKIFSYLSSGRPIIACVDKDSDVFNLINKSGGGICVSPENVDELVKAIIKLKGDEDLRDHLSKKGREYCANFHSSKYAAEEFIKLFNIIYFEDGKYYKSV